MSVTRRATIAGLGTVALAPLVPALTALALTALTPTALAPTALAQTSPVPTKTAQMPTLAEATAIAKGAWIYAYPMMENYNTMYLQAVDAKSSAYVGGFNKYRHYSEPFTPANRDIVTPNNDTPYSWAWLDLRAEPIVLTVPTVPKDRYYVCQFFDLFTYNFAYVGVRATGFEGASYLFAGPNWTGETPKGIKQVFRAETDLVGTLTRTALNGPEDVANVRAIQAGLKLQPLSSFLGQPAPPPAPAITFPVPDKAKEASSDFIAYLNFLLQFAVPPHPVEVTLRGRFALIGIEPGAPWEPSKIEPALLAAISTGVVEGHRELRDRSDATLSSNGLFGPRDPTRPNYLDRAVAARKGIYGNSLEEAWYGGAVGDGSKPSTIRFNKGNLPPANFFWSMTLYTLPDRLLYANALNRYSIGDRTKGLKVGADGSLTITVSHDPPATPEAKANWLPAPNAKYSLVTRVYGPKPELMNGTWKLPPLQPAP